MSSKLWLTCLSLVLLAFAMAFAACGDDDDEATTGGDSTPGVNAMTVTMSDELVLDPDRIEVRVGEPVRLTINNSGIALHDFTVEDIAVEDVMSEGSDAAATGGHGMDTSTEYDLHVAIDGGESGTLEFTPMKAGEYEFICTVTGHAEGGMTGALAVT